MSYTLHSGRGLIIMQMRTESGKLEHKLLKEGGEGNPANPGNSRRVTTSHRNVQGIRTHTWDSYTPKQQTSARAQKNKNANRQYRHAQPWHMARIPQILTLPSILFIYFYLFFPTNHRFCFSHSMCLFDGSSTSVSTSLDFALQSPFSFHFCFVTLLFAAVLLLVSN